MPNLKFDRSFLREIYQLTQPYWHSKECKIFLSFFLFNILLTLIKVRTSVAINTFSRNFYDALQNYNTALLPSLLLHFSLILCVYVFSTAYAFYINSILSLRWRRWLTQHYLQRWLHNHKHYHLKKDLDNPDQRISEDIGLFTNLSLNLFFVIFESLLTILWFGSILWNLSTNFSVSMGNAVIAIPGYLCWGAFLYALLGTLAANWIGRKLSGLDYQQQQYDANFRYSLVRLREASEQVALNQGEVAENKYFMQLFKSVFTNFMSIISIRKRLLIFTNAYNSTTFIFGLFMSIPLYIKKKIQFGGMMQISGAFSYVITACSTLINNFTTLTEWRSVVYRLVEFNKTLETAAQHPQANINRTFQANSSIKINALTLRLPNGLALIKNFNITIAAGERILICGQQGIGKSTLLRALAGVWDYGEGEICLPNNFNMAFLPQKPYLPLGTLHEALIYPCSISITNEKILELLAACGLNKLQPLLHETRPWLQELSLGELQIIGFIRLILQKPAIIFLDEATSALNEEKEKQMYCMLYSALPNTSIVSVSHSRNLHQLHHKTLVLENTIKESFLACAT